MARTPTTKVSTLKDLKKKMDSAAVNDPVKTPEEAVEYLEDTIKTYINEKGHSIEETVNFLVDAGLQSGKERLTRKIRAIIGSKA